MKVYHVYYLPNASREYVDGTVVKGKVGYSCLDPELRKRLNKNGYKRFDKIDVSGHCILVDKIQSKDAAKIIEKRFQQILRCCEPNVGFTGKRHTNETKQKLSTPKLGSKHSTETKEKMRDSHLGKKRK